MYLTKSIDSKVGSLVPSTTTISLKNIDCTFYITYLNKINKSFDFEMNIILQYIQIHTNKEENERNKR